MERILHDAADVEQRVVKQNQMRSSTQGGTGMDFAFIAAA